MRYGTEFYKNDIEKIKSYLHDLKPVNKGKPETRIKIPEEEKITEEPEDEEKLPENIAEKIPIIGYEDVKNYIIEQLDPIINPEESKEWGLKKPGGILLYGPPGCGKTYWANWIAGSLLKYKFVEIPRSIFGSIYVDGAMTKLSEILNEVKEEAPAVIFFDEFDSVARSRDGGSKSHNESEKVVNTLLQEIPKLIEKDIIILAATNFVNQLDAAVTRPGRFDLKLPIFPPSPQERVELLVHTLKKDLSDNSPLLEILKNNNAGNIKFWNKFSKKMILFSNSHIIDTAELLKKRLKKLYKESDKSKSITLDSKIILQVIDDIKSKLTKKEVEIYANFHEDLSANKVNAFNKRMKNLKKELKEFYGDDDDKPRPIGFRIPNV